MPNNFRKTGSYYISNDGSDLNDGLSANTPKATFAKYGAGTHIVGTGVYKNSPNLINANMSFEADETVILDLTGSLLVNHNSGTASCSFKLIHFRMNGFNVFTRLAFNTWNDCIIEAGVFRREDALNGTGTFNRTALKDMTDSAATSGLLNKNIDYCSLFNCQLFSVVSFKNSYADVSTSFDSMPATFNNNCFEGYFDISGTRYELKQDKDGNAINPNPAYLDAIEIDPNIYTNGNFSQAPGFLNLSKNDFRSITISSPLVFSSDIQTNIANTILGIDINAVLSEAVSLENIILDAGDYVYDQTSGAGFGRVAFRPVKISSIPQIITYAHLVALLLFNSNEAIGSSENINVPMTDNYATGTAGANPRRLTYELRWSTQQSEPLLDAEFDNNSIVTAGNYSKFEHFTRPKIDIASLGNGDPAFNPSGAVDIQPVWVQLRQTVQYGIG